MLDERRAVAPTFRWRPWLRPRPGYTSWPSSPSRPNGSAYGSTVAGPFVGKLHTRVDGEFCVHVREVSLHSPPGNE
jgi:hypothetical protein